MAMQPAAAALDGGDPRLGHTAEGIANLSRRTVRNLHDPNVTFEEYLHYAAISRADEARDGGGNHVMSILPGKYGRKHQTGTEEPVTALSSKGAFDKETEVSAQGGTSPSRAPGYTVEDAEWIQASRAARTATWGAVFYLITTDILGPYSVPWAMSRMGYGPGIVLYTIFGALAGYSGWQLWRMFLRLDSDRYPLKTYGDVAFRVYGTWARITVNLLQSIQLLCNVGVIIISNAQSLSQITTGNLCFVVCCVVFTVAGAVLGQIRTLQKFGWIANAAIWMNLLVIFITMGVVAHSEPNFEAAKASNEVDRGPIITTGGPPDGVAFEGQVVGLMQAVYSYGGAMLFCEFMSEMKRPWDFWKGMICAQSFIFFFYLMFGLYVYSFQGQFTINPVYQGLSPYNWQTAANVIAFVAALIAAALYGNIGIKVLYNNLFTDVFHFPPLTEKRGKLLWVGIVPIYWIVAFIIAAAIPQFSNLTALVAAICILQFTYTFPPFFMLGFEIKQHAMQPGEGFDPATGRVTRFDGGFARFKRGFARQWYIKTFNIFYMLGAACCAVLGAYSAVKGIVASFQSNPAITSFGCTSPIGG